MGVGLLGANVNITPALRDLERLSKAANYGQAVALTRVAQLAQSEVIRETRRVFDRPTPFTLNSTFIKAATPGRLVATVGFKGSSAAHPHYLAAEVTGGARSMKRFEALLRRAGVLGVNEYLVPAKGFPLDAFGNIPRNVYAAMLSDLRAHPDTLSRSTAASRAKRSRRRNIVKRAIYFAARPGDGLPLGIYQRVRTHFGAAIRGVFMFVRAPSYKVRLPLLEIVTKIYDLHMVEELDRQLANAFATQR